MENRKIENKHKENKLIRMQNTCMKVQGCERVSENSTSVLLILSIDIYKNKLIWK
jgi:hypothetical protein